MKVVIVYIYLPIFTSFSLIWIMSILRKVEKMKHSDLFTDFSDQSKIWIYSFDHNLSEEEIKAVTEVLTKFIPNWNSHGDPVKGDFVVVYNRFVILCADNSEMISGCSIDSSVRVFKDLKQKQNLDALNQDLLFFRYLDNEIFSADRREFQDMVNAGKIDSKSIVFNNTIQTLRELRKGAWETPSHNSWHISAFDIAV